MLGPLRRRRRCQFATRHFIDHGKALISQQRHADAEAANRQAVKDKMTQDFKPDAVTASVEAVTDK